MLHAAAMFVGLYILAFTLLAPSLGAQSAMASGVVSLFAVVFALRFGGTSAAFARVISASGGAARSLSRVVRGALKTIRAAAAADIVLQPALIRIRAMRAEGGGRVRLAQAIGAAPGGIVVEIDDGGLLVHVNDESGPEVADIEAIEERARGGGAA